MTTIPFWHVRLHTISDYTWADYFMYQPTTRDIRDALSRMPHCPAPLIELAEHIPDDYISQMNRCNCPSIMYRTEVGTIRIREEAAHAATGEETC